MFCATQRFRSAPFPIYVCREIRRRAKLPGITSMEINENIFNQNEKVINIFHLDIDSLNGSPNERQEYANIAAHPKFNFR